MPPIWQDLQELVGDLIGARRLSFFCVFQLPVVGAPICEELEEVRISPCFRPVLLPEDAIFSPGVRGEGESVRVPGAGVERVMHGGPGLRRVVARLDHVRGSQEVLKVLAGNVHDFGWVSMDDISSWISQR